MPRLIDLSRSLCLVSVFSDTVYNLSACGTTLKWSVLTQWRTEIYKVDIKKKLTSLGDCNEMPYHYTTDIATWPSSRKIHLDKTIYGRVRFGIYANHIDRLPGQMGFCLAKLTYELIRIWRRRYIFINE